MSLRTVVMWPYFLLAIIAVSCSPTPDSVQPSVWHPMSAEAPPQRQPIPVALGSPQIPVPIMRRTAPVVRSIKPIAGSMQEQNTRIVVDLAQQRASLFVNNRVVLTSPISSGRAGHATPAGHYRITEKVASGKVSNLYHVEMPWWMRLNHTAIGMHAGYLPGYPASAGCVRLPPEMAKKFFHATNVGTLVEIR